MSLRIGHILAGTLTALKRDLTLKNINIRIFGSLYSSRAAKAHMSLRMGRFSLEHSLL